MTSPGVITKLEKERLKSMGKEIQAKRENLMMALQQLDDQTVYTVERRGVATMGPMTFYDPVMANKLAALKNEEDDQRNVFKSMDPNARRAHRWVVNTGDLKGTPVTTFLSRPDIVTCLDGIAEGMTGNIRTPEQAKVLEAVKLAKQDVLTMMEVLKT